MNLRPTAALGILALCAMLAAPSAPVAAAGDTILFGSPVSLTGNLTKEGHLTQEGYELWKNYVNAHGGIKVGGKTYKVDIKYYDDESKNDTSAQLAERLIDQDHVNFLLGPYGSGTSFTVAQIAERKKIPMVEGNGAAEKIFNQGFKYTFGVLSPAKRYLEGILEMAQRAEAGRADRRDHRGERRVLAGSRAGRGRLGDRARHEGRLQQQVSRHRDRRVVDHLRAQADQSRRHPERRPSAGRAARAEGPQGAERPREGLRLLRRPRHPRLRRLARQGRERRLRRRAVVGRGEIQGRPGFYRTAQEYAKAIQDTYHHRADYHNAESTARVPRVPVRDRAAGSLDPEKVRDALAKLDVTTFYGIIKFDSRGSTCTSRWSSTRFRRATRHGMAALTAEGKPMYPAPPWGQR